MAIITYTDVNPTLIPNTDMRIMIRDGANYAYLISACEGYVLHDKMLDIEEFDETTGEPTGNIILGYYAGTRTVPVSYDFTTNPREFYAVPEDSVPAERPK